MLTAGFNFYHCELKCKQKQKECSLVTSVPEKGCSDKKERKL
jgi:hypothetical protein